MLIAEAILLLALDDEKGTIDSGAWLQIDNTIGGALLLELALRERIEVTGEQSFRSNGEPIKPGRLVIRNPAPTGDEILDSVLERLPKVEGKKADWAIPVAYKGARDALTERLADAGVLTKEKRKVLGIFSSTAWPTADGAPEAELRSRIVAVLDQGAEPDQLTGCVIALAQAANVLAVLIPTKDKELRQARSERAKKLATAEGQGSWAIGATSAAVQATMVALSAATMTTVISAAVVTGN
jgi:hypothetical protein